MVPGVRRVGRPVGTREWRPKREKTGRLSEPPGLLVEPRRCCLRYDRTRTLVAAGLLFLPVPDSNDTD